VIDGSLAVIECRLGIVHDAGDHELVTGEVLGMEVGQGVPLLFYRGGFAQLTP
jgi:flavin reductase (DIM6/NTAB) family NADH-FMN oxidoreductase RutF